MLKLTANNWYFTTEHSERRLSANTATGNRDGDSISALDGPQVRQTLTLFEHFSPVDNLDEPVISLSRDEDSASRIKRLWGSIDNATFGIISTNVFDDSRHALASIFDNIPLRNVSTVDEELNGEYLSDYILIEKLGEGGMGVIMSARQRGTHRLVALKILKNKLLSQREAVVRFLFEAEILAELDHPSVVPVYEVAASGKTLFFSMKLLEGMTWKQLIRQLPQVKNVDVLSKVCEAVGYAHSKGIVNRDLKPENVIIGNSGEVFVTDWGLAIHQKKDASPIIGIDSCDKARLIVEDASRFCVGDRVFLDDGDVAPEKFQVKSILAENRVDLDRPISRNLELSPAPNLRKSFSMGGTPVYMSPEAACHSIGQIGPRSDIYLLGAMLFEILTLEIPHRGSTVSECLKAAIKNDISASISKSRTAADAMLMRVALQAMSTNPNDRFATAQDFQAAMRQCLFIGDR